MGTGTSTVWIAAIPTNWNIGAQGTSRDGCDSHYAVVWGSNNGGRDICLVYGGDEETSLISANYFFQGGKKRGAPTCDETVKPNFLYMSAETQYDIQGVGEDDYQRFVSSSRRLYLWYFTNSFPYR